MRADNRAPDPSELDPIEIASRDEISALQLERLRWTLGHAYANVAHYKTAFDQAGVHPDDLKDLADLAKFPFTVKTDLRDNYPFDMFAVPREQVVRIHASSGTTGNPTVVGYTQADLDMWSGLMARSIRAAGGRPGDIVHVAYGYGLFTGGLGAHYGAERLGCTVVPVSGGLSERQIKLITDFKPGIIMVTPSYMLALADEFEAQGLDPRQSSLRVGIFGAEPWTEAMRAEIEARIGVDAIDIFGLSEVMGPGVSCECIETKDGLHIWEDHFYPEVIDPETGAVKADGEEGELVFTSLYRKAMPLLRYRTRDVIQVADRACPCGRTLFSIEGGVLGRLDDMKKIRGVIVYPMRIEEIVRTFPEMDEFMVYLRRKEGLDEITVEIDPSPEVSKDAHPGLKKKMESELRLGLGIRASVEIVESGALPRWDHKARRVKDEREEVPF